MLEQGRREHIQLTSMRAEQLTGFDLGWLLLMTVLVLALLARKNGVGRSEGVAILLLYALFVAVQIVAEST